VSHPSFHPSFRFTLLAALTAALLLLSPAGAAFAAGDAGDAAAAAEAGEPAKKSRRQQEEERRKYTMQPHIAKRIGKVREHLEGERYADAEKELGKLRLDRLSPYERAQAERLRGYVAYGQEQNDAAIEALSAALAEDGLPPADRADVLFQIAQIQAVERRWRDVIGTLEDWFASVERPNSVGYFLTALSHYQLEDVEAALLPATKAVQIAKLPQQSWLQLLLAIHLTRKDYAAAAPVLEQLLVLYPKVGKSYWLQLSALYGVTEEDNKRALGILEVAYRKGLLTENADLRRLVQLTLFRGIPLRAAQIIEKELAGEQLREDGEALELLSASWILAREVPKAEAPLARAAELSEKGDLYVRLAQIQMLQEEWEEAAATLRKALAKGEVSDPGTVQLLLGIAYYNERKLPEARTWFAHAQQSGATREQARTWLEHVDREIAAESSGSGTPG
jgi:tetratricopeptide (TPR) repeat protein